MKNQLDVIYAIAVRAFGILFPLIFALACFAEETTFRQVFAEKENEIAFEKTSVRFLKFAIYSSQSGAPAIDELLVFGEDNSQNLARKHVKQVAASSCISGYEIHKIENINDGKFGNSSAWVAADIPSRDNPQWLLYEWDEPVEVVKVVYSRDREGTYSDRMPLAVEIFASINGENWNSLAKVRGTSATIDGNQLVSYGSPWIANAPIGAAKLRSIIPPESLSNEAFSAYELALQDAFLGEENAVLKVAGFADIEPWLLQRHYPEFVEPQRKPENVLPVPSIKDVPTFDPSADNTELWLSSSSGTERVFNGGSFFLGGLLEQTVSAVFTPDALLLRISGDRFLSENIAMIGTENIPDRAFITLRDDVCEGKVETKVLWKQIDPLDERDAGSETELDGCFNPDANTLQVKIPLQFLPDVKERGFYVGLGIGARRVMPGGRPVHFKPAPFALELAPPNDFSADFEIRLVGTSDEDRVFSINAEDVSVQPGKTTITKVQGEWGYAGPELVCSIVDQKSGDKFRVVGLKYNPSYRPLCQLKDMLERSESRSTELDERDFAKQVRWNGSVNPRYVDSKAILAKLGDQGEAEALIEYFNDLQKRPELSSVETEALACWQLFLDSLKNSARDEDSQRRRESLLATRNLFLRVRLLKRDLFLSNPELESLSHILANKRNPFWPSHNYSDLFDSTWNPGGAVVMIDIPFKDGRLAPEEATARNLVEAGDGVIRNPSQSFDAQKIYYAKRISQNEYYRIFELDLTSGVERRISPPGPFHDFWPTELPDGGLAFVSTRCKKKFICWRPQAFVLHRMDMDGTGLEPLSYANLSEFAPSVCDDGRIMWTRSEYVDKGADYGHTLWTIRADGTSPELTFGNTINLPQGYANGKRVPDSNEVCCVMISHFGDLNGPVALIDLSKGPHDPSAIRSITPEVPWPGYWARSETFREPTPISRDIILVSHAHFDRFGVYLIDRFGNRELLTIDPEIDTICPQPFAPRETPPVTGASADPTLADQKLGYFSVANVYRGLEGQVKPGAAKYLRVCQELPTNLIQLDDGTYQADHEPFMEYYASPVDVLQGAYGWPSYVAKGVLGTVEIEEDGSVDFLVPAEKVLFFELLDENYNEIQRMRSVVQLRPGERRSCVGCHENRLSAPEGGLTKASAGDPQRLVAPPWGAGPFWYERIVQPILNKHCVECHNADTAALASRIIDLTGDRDANKIPNSYRSLIQSGTIHYFDYTWGGGKTTKAAPYTFGVAKSRLFDVLKEAQHDGVNLSPEEEQAIKCWIDLNVPLWGDYQIRRDRK